MNEFVIFLRLVHVTLGVFWAGTIFFLVLFLGPSVRAVGPEGARVMQAIQQRHFMNVMPVVALLTILSGLILYWRLSGGLAGAWLTSSFGLSLTIGGVASILAFAIGVSGMRASTLKASRLGKALASIADGGEREAMQAEIQRLRLRAAASARWVAALLVIAVATMAVARYL